MSDTSKAAAAIYPAPANTPINEYSATIHARCPVDDSWDYYVVTIICLDFTIRCEDIQHVLNCVRGRKYLQEELAERIHTLLCDASPDCCDQKVSVVVAGSHPHGIQLQARYS